MTEMNLFLSPGGQGKKRPLNLLILSITLKKNIIGKYSSLYANTSANIMTE